MFTSVAEQDLDISYANEFMTEVRSDIHSSCTRGERPEGEMINLSYFWLEEGKVQSDESRSFILHDFFHHRWNAREDPQKCSSLSQGN